MALTGFLINRGSDWVCADGVDNAMLALGARFPYVAGSQPVLCSLEGTVFTAPNTFTNTIACHNLTGNQSWTFSHPLTLVQCDPTVLDSNNAAMFSDGMAMGWGVVAAMVAAFCITYLRKALIK